jgi:DNA-binding CsgD family transcriptional regulator/tetratricopeptide (TPR) repeat protein
MHLAARPFVGRDGDLRRFHRAVDTGVRLVVVEGEAGIGKTRMLDEGVARLSPSPLIMRGTADRDDPRPLGPVAEALDRHVAAWTALPDGLRRHRDVIGSVFGRAPVNGRTDRELGRAELLDGVVATVAHILSRGRGLLVLDDVHWGDADLFAALRRIVCSELPCSVVITRRNDDESSAFVDLLDDVTRRATVERLDLGPLGVEDVRRLLHVSIGMAATAMADDIHDRTGGHPLLLHQLIDTGELGGEPSVSALPSTIAESVHRRLVRLDEKSRSVLHSAAVLGPSITFEELSAFTDLSESRLIASLLKLCDERLLVESAPDCFTFVHALTREVVESASLSRECRALHRRALDVLPDDTAPVKILRHAILAGDAARTLEAARNGATVAVSDGRPAMAERMATAGLQIDPDDLSLNSIAARAAWQLGRHDQAREAAERTLLLASETDVSLRAELHRLLARLARDAGDFEVHRANVDAVKGLLDIAGVDDRLQILDVLAEVTMLTSDDDAISWAEQAFAAFEKVGVVQATVLVNLGAALTDVPGRRDEGRVMLRRAVELGEAAGDSVVQSRALNNLLCEVVYTHDEDAHALVDRLESIIFGGGLGAQFGEQIALFRGLLAEREGDQQAVLDALGWFGPGEPTGPGCLAIFAAAIETGRGLDAPARQRLASISALMGGRVGHTQGAWMRTIDATLRLRGGDADAVRIVEELMRPDARLTRYMLDHLDQLGQALLALARTSKIAADTAVNKWREWAAGDPDGAAIYQHLCAVAAEHAADFVTARNAYLRSLDGLPRRAATVVADAHRGIARCWNALGDRSEARCWASSAVTVVEAWPGPDLDESVQLLRSFGGRPPRSGRDLLLSDREREVAVQVSRGLTNVEIGVALHISPRTVGVHVGHILEKLRAVNRAEIAAYAVRQELAG